jgi:ferredoxin
MPAAGPWTLDADRLDILIGALQRRGYQVVGPIRRQGGIVHDQITSAADLPRGWTDDQGPASYRLRRDERDLYFGFTAPVDSWKRFLFPPSLRLWQAQRTEKGVQVTDEREPPPKYAFLGVRACDLHAIAVQDRVFIEGPQQDRDYRERRQAALIVAVNCSQAAATCFCTSMGTGPRAGPGFDLALTELRDGSRHRFLVEAGSPRGEEVASELPLAGAVRDDLEASDQVTAEATAQVGRAMPAGIAAVLRESYEHPRWQDVGARCLSCTNCTIACPTCFCIAVEDTTDLTGDTAERARRWDSCFTPQHSYIHGGSVHQSTVSRYRQWMVHKLSAWHDQFGTSGCVGCGRCITWCPAAIDITEEAAVIAGTRPEASC